MYTGLIALIFTSLVIIAIVSQVLWYRRDTYRVVTALKEADGFMRSLDLVRKHKVSRTYVHLVLRDLIERGYVQRIGKKPPYLYRWRQK